jgi:hypothetical protein
LNKKIVVYVVAGMALAGLSAFGVRSVYAQGFVNGYPAVVQKIADKFHLNLSDVQAVFNQDRQDRESQMQTRFTGELDQAVSQGKLTAAQKQLILDKRQELQTARQADVANWKKLTQDLKSWAAANNIDLKYLRGPGMMFRNGRKVSSTPTPTP